MGKSDAERARKYRERKRGGPARLLEPHGTPAAHSRHVRAGETPCDECAAAEAKRQHELYENRKARALDA